MNRHIEKANSILIAASISLIFFAILNIAKESNSSVKNFLNFYPPVGPLLGLFLLSLVIYIVAYYIFVMIKPKNQKVAFSTIVFSSITFFLLVFPPVFDIFISLLKNK